jgi:hypothetical protein
MSGAGGRERKNARDRDSVIVLALLDYPIIAETGASALRTHATGRSLTIPDRTSPNAPQSAAVISESVFCEVPGNLKKCIKRKTDYSLINTLRHNPLLIQFISPRPAMPAVASGDNDTIRT